MNKTVIGLLLWCVNSVLIGLRCVFDVLNARSGPDTGGANGAIWPGRHAPERGRHSQGAPVRAPHWEVYLRSSTLPMGVPDSAPLWASLCITNAACGSVLFQRLR